MPAIIGAFELEPFDDELCEEPPLRLCDEPDEPLLRAPDEDERDAPEEERLLDALRLEALLAFVVERGLLFDALPLLEAFEPFELCDDVRFLLLDELVFACAIAPPWVFDSFAAEIFDYPDSRRRNAQGDSLQPTLRAVDLASLSAAFGLSAAAGLNAWLPLFGAALAQRLDLVELAQPFDDLSGTGALAVLGVLTVADFVGDKIPAVDHVLHTIGTVIAPASGAALFTGQTGAETDLPTLAAILLGAGTAESIHAGRAAIRPLSTVTTAGVGNPVLSLLEDLGALGLMLAAFIVPVLAVLAAIALLALIVVAWRRRPRPG